MFLQFRLFMGTFNNQKLLHLNKKKKFFRTFCRINHLIQEGLKQDKFWQSPIFFLTTSPVSISLFLLKDVLWLDHETPSTVLTLIIAPHRSGHPRQTLTWKFPCSKPVKKKIFITTPMPRRTRKQVVDELLRPLFGLGPPNGWPLQGLDCLENLPHAFPTAEPESLSERPTSSLTLEEFREEKLLLMLHLFEADYQASLARVERDRIIREVAELNLRWRREQRLLRLQTVLAGRQLADLHNNNQRNPIQ